MRAERTKTHTSDDLFCFGRQDFVEGVPTWSPSTDRQARSNTTTTVAGPTRWATRILYNSTLPGTTCDLVAYTAVEECGDRSEEEASDSSEDVANSTSECAIIVSVVSQSSCVLTATMPRDDLDDQLLSQPLYQLPSPPLCVCAQYRMTASWSLLRSKISSLPAPTAACTAIVTGNVA
jgi:hypothetical protein|eukprot:COSAG01_NODE_2896_length_6894_cov_4.250147_3_plen_178_part_00